MQALRSLGSLNAKGDGVEPDFKEAIRWYEEAVDRGDVESQQYLGSVYEERIRKTQEEIKFFYVSTNEKEEIKSRMGRDLEQAKKWNRKAEEQGNIVSQRNLGWLLLKENLTEAMEWFRRAVAQGDLGAKQGLDYAMSSVHRLSQPEQIPEALFNAKTAHLVNDGAMTAHEGSFIKNLRKWGRFELVEEKAAADIVILFSTRPEYASFAGTNPAHDCYMIVTKGSDTSLLGFDSGYVANGGLRFIVNLRKKMEERA
jgi:TPR repeat protein